MFLFDDREGPKKIINLDNLVNIEIEEGALPDLCLVVCIMIDGRKLAVHQDSRDGCVRLVEFMTGHLNSAENLIIMSEITG